MGIKGLDGFIKRKVPNARRAVNWTEGGRWGIDCSCILYRARSANLVPITVIASLLVRMRRCGIEPVVIFDGKPPAAKADTMDQRRTVRQAAHKEMADIRSTLEETTNITERVDLERRHAALQKKAPTVTNGDRDELKQFLHAAGVRFVTASGEADDVLAHLCRTGFLQAVISTDMDMLARGVPRLIVPETNDATVLTEIILADVLSGLRLSYPQFVDACMLMGSDYSGKEWRPVDPKQAVEVARKGVVWDLLEYSGGRQGVALLMGVGVRWEGIVSDKQRAKWDLGVPICEPDNLATFAQTNGWPTDWAKVLTI